jgi:hypothetical protein
MAGKNSKRLVKAAKKTAAARVAAIARRAHVSGQSEGLRHVSRTQRILPRTLRGRACIEVAMSGK